MKKGGTKKTTKKTAPRAKKTVAKKVAKKATKRKVVSKTSSKSKAAKRTSNVHITRVTDPDKHFWVHHGPVICDLRELAKALQEMSDDQYNHHTRRESGTNDFARWIEDVLGEALLAQKLSRTRSRLGTRKVIVTHIAL